jgi:protein SCO1/2
MKTLVLAVIAAMLGLSAVFVVGLPARDTSRFAPERDLYAWHRLEADEPAPDFSLSNQDGRRVRLKDLSGKVVVMTFFFSHCMDVCPTQLNILDAFIGELTGPQRERLVLVGVSIDPVRDTPARLKAFSDERGLDAKRWQLLTGTLYEVAKVASDYGIVVRPAPLGDFVHNSVYILIDAAGQERVEFHGIATPRGEVLKDIRALLAEAPARIGG